MHNFLIIGQGLAGTLIGYRLEKAGQSVVYLDHPGQTSASSVAAGIINPVTGRRYVKSWRIDELLPAARSLYAELEAELGSQFWYDLPLVRTLFNRGELNEWDVRSNDENYADYTEDNPALGAFKELTHPAFAYAGIRHTARVDIGKLVAAYREKLVNEGRFYAAPFQYADLEFTEEGNFKVAVSLPKSQEESHPTTTVLSAENVIFSEGWRGNQNPWFNYLPFGGAKGEVLHVKLAGPMPDRMLKHRVFLVPQQDDTFWVGATAENRFTNDQPTADNAAFLEDRLKELVCVPYEIVGHQAAIRPTVKDRKPFLGRHPNYPKLIIFNGLGTKGASVAPLTSQWLAEHLLAGKELPAEVNIERFALVVNKRSVKTPISG